MNDAQFYSLVGLVVLAPGISEPMRKVIGGLFIVLALVAQAKGGS